MDQICTYNNIYRYCKSKLQCTWFWKHRPRSSDGLTIKRAYFCWSMPITNCGQAALNQPGRNLRTWKGFGSYLSSMTNKSNGSSNWNHVCSTYSLEIIKKKQLTYGPLWRLPSFRPADPPWRALQSQIWNLQKILRFNRENDTDGRVGQVTSARVWWLSQIQRELS